jgi:hypothetical protein
MNKNQFFSLICFLTFALPFVKAQTDREKENLKGQIKEITEYLWESDSKKLNRKAFFGIKGMLNEEQTYHIEGNFRAIFNYNAERQLSTKQIFNPKNVLTEEWTWKYNSKGQNTERSQTKFQNGKMEVARVFDCKYNSKGQLEIEKEMDSKKKIIGTFKFQYNENGTLHILTVVVGKLHFFYNDKNQVIETKFYTEDGEYNAQKKFAFDEQGNQIEYSELQVGEEKPYSVEKDMYQYDNQNNWIRRETTYLNGKLRIMTREIIYHEE